MTDPTSAVAGAKLDELEAITREYALLGESALGLSGLGLAAWIAFAVLASRADGTLGAIAYAACAPVVLGVMAIEGHRAFRHGVVAAKPDAATRESRISRVLVPGLTTAVLVNLLVRGPVWREAGAIAVPLVYAVTFGLVVTPSIAARRARGVKSTFVEVALWVSLLREVVTVLGVVPLLLFVVVLAAGSLWSARSERRALRALEGRLAFLREQAR